MRRASWEWGCTSCRPCTANIHALAQSGIRRATFWELPTLVLADRWSIPVWSPADGAALWQMIEAPEVCAMRCAPILTETGGRVERGLSPSHHQTLVLAPNGLMIGTGGQERGCCGGPPDLQVIAGGRGKRPRRKRGLVDADRGRRRRMIDAPVPATTDWRRAEELFDAPKVL